MKLIILRCGEVPESLSDDLRHSDAVWLEADPDRPLVAQIGGHPPHLVVLGVGSPFAAADVRAASRGEDDVTPVLSLQPDPEADLCAAPEEIGPGVVAAALRLARLRRAAETRREDLDAAAAARERMNQRLQDEFRRARRDGGFVSLIVISLADSALLEHTPGDPGVEGFVQLLTDALRRSLRDGDVLFRSGEREFVVILPETRRAGAMTVAERLRTRAAGLIAKPQTGDDRPALPLKATPALGVAEAPAPEVRSADDLLVRARAALDRRPAV
jgi:diguanylate cyclase (GGDEF)-like protein